MNYLKNLRQTAIIFFKSLIPKIKKHPWYSALIILVAFLTISNLLGGNGQKFETEKITIRDIQSIVSVTGRVKASEDISLAFEKSGKVATINARVGEKVLQGRVLVSLEDTAARARVLEAKAKLTELSRGSRPEEITIAEKNLNTKEGALREEYGGAENEIRSAYQSAHDAVRVKTIGLFSGNLEKGYEYILNTCSAALENEAENLRQPLENDLKIWAEENKTLSQASPENLKKSLKTSKSNLEKVRSLLDTLGLILTSSCASGSEYDTYRANIKSAKDAVLTTTESVIDKIEAITAAENSFSSAEAELALKKSGGDPSQIEAQKAKVLEAESDYAQYKIVAPISGTIAKMDIDQGERVSAGDSLISIISSGNLIIETNVPENDIPTISQNNLAEITLDAYGKDLIFLAKVIEIDPAATIIANVPTYKVTLIFEQKDERIRPGMTADLRIKTSLAKGVLTVSERAIKRVDGKNVLQVLENAEPKNVPVKLGLRDGQGFVEVSGEEIAEGQEIVIKEIK